MGNEKTKIESNNLLELFKHNDDIVMSKENLFIPISVAIIPAIILKWEEMNCYTIIAAAIASISLYGYLLLVIRRFGAIQDNIFALLRAHYSDFETLMTYPKCLSVRPLRYYFFFVIVFIWFFLFLIN